MCPSSVGEVVRAVDLLARQQGRNYGPDADVLDVFGDDTSVMVVYRHRYAQGVFGYRQDVTGNDEVSVKSDALDVATVIWHAEIEPMPDVEATQEVAGIQWWGDPPFPTSTDSA